MRLLLPPVIAVCLSVAAIAAPEPAKQSPAAGAKAYPPQLEGAKVETYKKCGGAELKVWIFQPEPAAGEKSAPAKRPAIVFFFGGGWKSGSPAQFERHCRHLASRGIIALTADYRVASRHQARPAQCVADAKSCIRWVRSNAGRLGIDPERIAAGGGSAGGHLAAAAATVPGLDDPGDDLTVSAVPNALVLFNPAVIMAPYPGVDLRGFGAGLSKEKFGCEPEAISPIHHLGAKTPPTLIQHGQADTTVPYATVAAYAEAMKKAGARCDLVGYADQPHGFFNQAKFAETLAAADRFLVSLGYLPPAPDAAARP